ncbi:MAG: AAA family ATPase [Proteobacteria bacterium]|nr:AAA family ATPase [Pseudomonadota bacterium]
MSKYDSLWVEKYRPKTLKDLILNDENRTFFSSLNDEIPHIMLWGNAGTGKTTLAKLIVNDILKCQYLYINASDENGVDTIRNKVISFSQVKSFDGKKKIIILDESDGLTNEGQRILRNVMEEYAENARFILTANYFNRIIEPIRSRCILFNLKPDLEESYLRCIHILQQENVTLDDNQREDLKKFVEKRHPDLRRIINDLQKFSLDKNFEASNKNNILSISTKIVKALLNKESSLSVRKIVIENESAFDSNYQLLYKEIFDLIYNSKFEEKRKKNLLLELGEYMYRDTFVLDHEINFFCCLMAIENSLN